MAFTVAAIGGVAVVNTVATAISAHEQGKISDRLYEDTINGIKKYQDSLEAPPGTAPKFTPEEFAAIQKFSPQIAQHVQEKSPEMLTEAKSGAAIRAQNEGLQDLRSRVMSGKDVISDAQQEEALFNADAQAKGRREQILQSLANRGLSGSGQDILAQNASSQQAQVNARQQSLDAAKGAEARRMEALGQMTNLASNIRGQNRQTEATNADIMNSYNQRLAAGQNAYNQYAANTNNAAQQFNIGNDAQVSHMNTNLRNAAGRDNMIRSEDAKRELRDFKNNTARDVLAASTHTAGMAANNARQNVGNWTGVVTGAASGAGQVAAGMHADERNDLNRQAMTRTDKYSPTMSAYDDPNENDPILKNSMNA